ncbi:hypothetical protein KCV01_g23770, partial [Aureobasidium melanogenum]
MVDIPLLIQVLAPLEGLIKRVRASGQPLRRDGVDVLGEAADLVDHVMALFDTPDAPVPDVSALAARIAALRDEQPEATVAHILYEPDPMPLDGEESSISDDADVAPTEEATASIDVDDVSPAFDEPVATPIDPTFEAMLADELASHDAQPEMDDELPPVDLPSLESLLAEGDLSAGLLAAYEETPLDIAEGEVKPILAFDPAEEAAWRKLDSEAEASLSPTHEGSADVGADLVGDDVALPLVDTTTSIEDVVDPAPQESPTGSAPTEEAVDAEEIEDAGDVAGIEEHAHEVPEAHEPVLTEEAALVPERSPYADIDPDLLEVFVEEGREILDHADGALAAWRAEPQQPEHVASLQRDLHTLKGSARMAGMAPVGDLAHAMETLLDAVAAGQRE